MAIFDTLRHFSALITWTNLRKGITVLRRGELAVLRGAIRNLIDLRKAVDPRFHAHAQKEAVRFPPVALADGEPLVAIVIPCFNYGEFVGEAVQSALNQTFRNVEVLVVDGGSTDGRTRNVVAALEGERVRVFLREGRHLAGDNRNFGIERTAARYVVCLDADDTLAPTFVEKALFLAEHCAFDVVSTGLQLFGAKTGKVGIMMRPKLRDIVAGNQVYTCALFRRSLWADAGGYFDYGLGQDHAAEDWDFWIRLAAGGARICNIAGEQLLNYRVHAGGSLSSSKGVPELSEQRQRILTRLGDICSDAALERSSKANAEIRVVASASTALAEAMSTGAAGPGERCILIAVPFFLVGGAERLLVRLVHELQETGWRVVLVSTVAQAADDSDAISWFEKLTLEVYALPRFAEPRYWRAFIDYLMVSRRFSAILIAGSRLFYELLPELKAARVDLKAIDFLFNTEGHTEPHARLRAHFNGVLCENAEVEAWYRNQGWRESDIALIESRVDVSRYQPFARPAALAAQFGIADDDIVIGWSGRLSEEKSPETFVEVARLCTDLPDVVFVMTGTGRLADTIAGQVAKLPPKSRFHLCGVVDDVRSYFELYDICLIPSVTDGRPTAALEALAAGCVLIASQIGGLPRLVEDGETGFLAPPADADFIADRIRSLRADRARLAAMQRAARRFAEEHLDVSKTDLPYSDAIGRLTAAAS